MVGDILLILLGLIIILLGVILIRTIRFKPLSEKCFYDIPVSVDREKVVNDLREMVRCRTVSYRDTSLQIESEFRKFRDLLPQLYPNVFRVCSYERIGNVGLLFRWPGLSSDNPAVMMSHYDVVPAKEDAWEKPAFEGIIEDGVLWGRGTLDTKGTLCGVMESAEKLISEDFTPQKDIYFSFSGNEEINGDGAPGIVAELKNRGIVPSLVVDEGGAVVEKIFPGVTDKCALIGIGEKGMMNMTLRIKSTGGHASAPPPHGPIGKLSKAVCDMENTPGPVSLSKPVAAMYDSLGRHSTFVYRMIFANLWLFLLLLDSICKKSGGELNAMMRTTCAFTMTEAGSTPNVLPPEASVTANFRIIAPETVDMVKDRVAKIINNDEIEIIASDGTNPSISSDYSCEGYEKLCNAVRATWPGVLVSPYLMVQCSDSRHFCEITDKVMRFSAIELTAQERRLIHANNERIPLDKIVTTVEFYVHLMMQL